MFINWAECWAWLVAEATVIFDIGWRTLVVNLHLKFVRKNGGRKTFNRQPTTLS